MYETSPAKRVLHAIQPFNMCIKCSWQSRLAKIFGAAVTRTDNQYTPAADEQAYAQQHSCERAGNDCCPDDFGMVLAAQPLLNVGRHCCHQDQAQVLRISAMHMSSRHQQGLSLRTKRLLADVMCFFW
jgi:hypothetical protein